MRRVLAARLSVRFFPFRELTPTSLGAIAFALGSFRAWRGCGA